MNYRSKKLLGMTLAVLLLSCSPTPAISPKVKPSGQIAATVNSAQTLPVSAQIMIAGQTIGLEVAQTPQQQEIGLMSRTALADNRGMLFPFEPPQPVKFWMKNTLIPLDMLFLRQGKVQAIASAVPPCTADPCPTYGPDTVVDQVIELRGGRAAELGLKVGNQVKIKFLSKRL